MKKQDARKLTPAAQEVIRMRAVDFLKRKKGTQRQAADFFQLSLVAVEKIWQRYKAGGVQALKAKKRGPHQCSSSLSKKSIKEITRLIKKDTPDTYHLPYYLWTANAVRLLIKKKPK
jgi:transposase